MKLIALLLMAPLVVTGRAGNVQTETYCDWQSGTFDQIVALGRALIDAAKRDDRRTMAALMSYPLASTPTRSSAAK